MGHYECSVCGDYLCFDNECEETKKQMFLKMSDAKAPEVDLDDELTPVTHEDVYVVVKTTNSRYGNVEVREFTTQEALRSWLINQPNSELSKTKVYKGRVVNVDLKLVID